MRVLIPSNTNQERSGSASPPLSGVEPEAATEVACRSASSFSAATDGVQGWVSVVRCDAAVPRLRWEEVYE